MADSQHVVSILNQIVPVGASAVSAGAVGRFHCNLVLAGLPTHPPSVESSLTWFGGWLFAPHFVFISPPNSLQFNPCQTTPIPWVVESGSGFHGSHSCWFKLQMSKLCLVVAICPKFACRSLQFSPCRAAVPRCRTTVALSHEEKLALFGDIALRALLSCRESVTRKCVSTLACWHHRSRGNEDCSYIPHHPISAICNLRFCCDSIS